MEPEGGAEEAEGAKVDDSSWKSNEPELGRAGYEADMSSVCGVMLGEGERPREAPS